MKMHDKILEVDIEKVIKNPWNPNKMTDKVFQQTVKHIRDLGFVGGIVVRETKGKYEIIDGEHRWRAAKELGSKKIPVIVLDLNDVQAEMATLNFNNLKGEFDNLGLAESLKRIKGEIGIDEAVDKLGYSEEELKRYDELISYDWSGVEGDDDSGSPMDIDSIKTSEDKEGSAKSEDYSSLNLVCNSLDKAVILSEIDRVKSSLSLNGHLADSRALKIIALRSARMKDELKFE